MHPSVAIWVKSKIDEHELQGDVLEVGSYDVNGSVRALFASGEYIGVDMREGPGVDQVAEAKALPFGDKRFDVVVSTEMLEHDAAFWLSVPEMARVLKPGGHLLVTARSTGFPIHDFPSDYWRFSPQAIGVLFDLAGLATVEIVPDPDPLSPGVFGLAAKPKRQRRS